RSRPFAPRVSRAVEPAASGEFPFGFDGQFFSCPGGVGARIVVSDVNDRVVIATLDATAGTLRMLPIRPGYVFPPLPIVAQVYRTRRLSKHGRAWHQQRGVGIRVHGGIGRTLAGRDVARRANEFTKLRVRHGMRGDPESSHPFPAHRALLAVEVV